MTGIHRGTNSPKSKIMAQEPGRRLLSMISTSRTRASAEDVWHRFRALDESTRFNITNSLAGVRGSLSRRLLAEIVGRDPSLLVRHEAAFALGCVGDRNAVGVLRRALMLDRSFLVRHEAAMSLSELGSRREIPALEAGLRDRSHEVVISCRVALQRIRERAAVAERTTSRSSSRHPARPRSR